MKLSDVGSKKTIDQQQYLKQTKVLQNDLTIRYYTKSRTVLKWISGWSILVKTRSPGPSVYMLLRKSRNLETLSEIA